MSWCITPGLSLIHRCIHYSLTDVSLSLAHRHVLVTCSLACPYCSLTSASLSLAYWCVLVAHLPTCHRHRHATITVSSGKPFDCQSVLDLWADTSLPVLSLAHQYVHRLLIDMSIAHSLMHPCCSLTDASFLIAHQQSRHPNFLAYVSLPLLSLIFLYHYE